MTTAPPAAPIDLTPAELGNLAVEAEHCMEVIRRYTDRIAMHDRLLLDQAAEIQSAYEANVAPLRAQIERAKAQMLPAITALVATDPSGRKSIHLAAGDAGFRKSSGQTKVDDVDAACVFLQEHALGHLVKVTYGPKVAEIKKELACRGDRYVLPLRDRAGKLLLDEYETLPGIHIEGSGDGYYCTPVPTGTPRHTEEEPHG
jgi:phage host-nuclease inhibitor protein Gam